MITDKQLDETLVELLRTKRALEALRAARKAGHKTCWNHTCVARRSPLPIDAVECPTCKRSVYKVESQVVEHAAAKRASLDLTRALAKLRKGDV